MPAEFSHYKWAGGDWGMQEMENRLLFTGALLLTFLGGVLMTELVFRILLGHM